MTKKTFLDGNFHLVIGTPPRDREYKKYRKMWNTYPKRRKVAYFPIHLDIELNTNCNYTCKKCFHSFDPPPHIEMPLEMVKKIIDEGAEKGLCSIKFNYRGEPLLYPHLVEVVKYAKDKGIIDVMFNTNGSLLDINLSYQLMKAGLDKIIISIDDHRDRMYTQLQSGELSIVKNNLRNLIVIRNFHDSNIPVIRIQKVDRSLTSNMNDDYMKEMAKYCDELAFHEYLDYQCKEYRDPMPNWCCASLWQRMLILADGTITACCGLNSNFSKLGHIDKNTIEELWHGPTMERYRELHMNGESHKIRACRNCPLRLHYRPQ